MTQHKTHSRDHAVPFHIEQRRLYRGGDLLHHEVGFGVVGVAEPTSVVVASDSYRDPVIVERLDRGSVELPDDLLDALAIRCFKLMSGEIIEQGGESGWWTLADVSHLVRRTFPQADAERILRELSRHAQPGLTVRSTCLVADDDAI